MELANVVDSEEEILIAEIEEEMRKIYVSVEKLYNNASLVETNDPIEKCLINNYYYSHGLLRNGVEGDMNRNGDILKSFEEIIKREMDYLTNDLDTLVLRMNTYKEQLSSIDRNILNLKEMMEAQKSETKSDRNQDEIMKNIKMRFRKEKSDLKAVVSILFQDSLEIQDLIARIVEHHFSEGTDKYLQLEDSDNITEQIELLRRTRLFETNPHDPLQIRLADLV